MTHRRNNYALQMFDAGGDAYFYAKAAENFFGRQKVRKLYSEKSDLCKVFIIDRTLRYKKIFLNIKGVSPV